jgi:putative transposase
LVYKPLGLEMTTGRFKKHIPFHLYVDGGVYFVTARTLRGRRLFNTNQKKIILANKINGSIKKFGLMLHAWVVLDNHYHIFFSLRHGNLLSKLVQYINGGSSLELNKLDKVTSRQVWWNYWDRNIRTERDFYVRFNYIHHNPVKHGYAKCNADYPFSSYQYYVKKLGAEFLQDAERSYPIIDYTGVAHDRG